MEQATQQGNHLETAVKSVLDAVTRAVYNCALVYTDDYAVYLGIPSGWISQILSNTLCPFTEGWKESMLLAYALLTPAGIKPENDYHTPVLEAVAIIDPQLAASFERVSGSLADYRGLMRSFYDFYAVVAGFPEIIGQPDEQLVGTSMLLSDLESDPEYSGDYRNEGYMTVKDYKEYIRAMVLEAQSDSVFSTGDRAAQTQHS